MKQSITILTLLVALYSTALWAQPQITYEGSPEYGRLYNIIFHPSIENKLYAVSLGNHIMESNDKGQTWQINYSYPANGVFLENFSMLSEGILTFSSNYNLEQQDNAVYFYDVAAGETTRVYAPPIDPQADKTWISSYAIYADNPDIALVHQSYRIGLSGYSKVYYTTDAGANWEMVYYNMDHNGIFPNNVAISPDNPQKLFIARGAGPNNDDGGLLISQDAGQTWVEKMPDHTFGVITFHPQDANNILLGTHIGDEGLGHSENLYRSLDGGQTWNTIPINWENGSQNNITGIVYNPLDLNNILVMEENEVVITHDNWASHTKTVYPLDNLEGYYYGVYASFNPFQNGELFVNADYYPLFSTDGGATFNRVYTPFHGAGMAGLQYDAEEHLLYSVQRGLIHKNLSTGAETAVDVEPINMVFIADAPIYMTDAQAAGRVYKYESSFSGSTLKVSDDYGNTYADLYTNYFDQLINLTTDPANPNKIWAVFLNEGGLKIDFTDSNNPVVTPVMLPENDILTDVYIDQTNSEKVFISVGAHIYRSTDGGTTWEDRSTGLGINPATDIIFDIERNPLAPDSFLVAASNGIYKSSDNTAHWERVHQAENVRKVTYSPLNETHAVATVPSGNGIDSQIIYTTDAGETWQALPFEAIAYVASSSMVYKFHEESVDAYIATYDLGIIKYTIDLNSLDTPDFTKGSNPFVVYPNPSTGVINIEENGDKMVSASIFNTLGQEVLKPTALRQIDITNLDDGLYFVRIKNAKGNYFVKQIIKR